jgi:hypothetical protein
VCRPSAGECDLEETCTGSSTACPANVGITSGTPCGNQGSSECDNPDTCDGVGSCQSNPVALGTACGDDTAAECSNADQCDGVGNCSANNVSDGTQCAAGDGNCSAGVCLLTPVSDAGPDAASDAGDASSQDAAVPDAASSGGSDGSVGPIAGNGGGGGGGNGGGHAGGATHSGGVPNMNPDSGAPSGGVGHGSGGTATLPDGAMPPDVINATDTPHGCNCSLPGRSASDPLELWLALGLVGIVLASRRAA